MDLERLDRISLGIAHGGTIDKTTFNQISALARKFLVEEKKLLEMSVQVTEGITFLRQLAQEMIDSNAESKTDLRLLRKFKQKLETQINQRQEWNETANRQQELINRLLVNTEILYNLINAHVNIPTEATENAIRAHIADNRL
jgi:hypothetical protein